MKGVIKMNDKIKEAAMLHPSLILPPYDEIIFLDGYDAICAFVRSFGSSNVYVPSLRSILKQCIEEEIRNRYNGKNLALLAKEYGCSDRYIRNVVHLAS